MQVVTNPNRSTWADLCQRPEIDALGLEESVTEIVDFIRQNGDRGLKHFTALLDNADLDDFVVPVADIEAAAAQVPEDLKAAIAQARDNIQRFHESQRPAFPEVETQTGVRCWSKQVPIERVGLYIPGGSAPLFSSLLMLAIPAKIAGCREVVVCTPPGPDGTVNPVILYTAQLLGVDKVIRAGGAQAIAAMAFGTESLPAVQKIFGPGNQYVTKAKEVVQRYGVAIDMPAGPSEVLVVADGEANPAYVAADLLSQAEHGPDSQVFLVSDSQALIDSTIAEVEQQVAALPREAIARQALANSKAVLFDSLDTAMDFSNAYAPEHLILNTANATELALQVQHAGSVFLGPYSCESAGDYASGTNHTLPTNGFARAWSGVSVSSFCKQITFQQLSAEGLQNIGPAVELMATAEGLEGHKNAVTLRLNDLSYV